MLDVMGRLTMYVGPSGTGNRIKLLHNALGAVNAAAVAESLALCVTLGVDPKTYYDVVKNGGGMAYSTYFDRRAMRVIEGNYDPTFTLELMLKDVTLASQMAGSQLEHMPILRDTLAAFTEGKRAGWGGEDFSGVTHVDRGSIRPKDLRARAMKGPSASLAPSTAGSTYRSTPRGCHRAPPRSWTVLIALLGLDRLLAAWSSSSSPRSPRCSSR